MEALFQLDANGWGVQVATLQRRLGLETKAVLTDQSRLFFEQVMDLTPPQSLAQGRMRTGADNAKVVKPFDPATVRSKRLRDILARGDHAAFTKFFSYVDNAAIKGARAGPFSADLHQRQRDGRGRILGKDRRFFVIGKTQVAALQAYRKRKLANVGYARSGWLLALWAVGGTAPAWVSNQLQRGQGGVENALDKEDPYIVAINKSPWSDRREEGARIIRYAARYRINAMETYLKKALERAAESAGLAVTAA